MSMIRETEADVLKPAEVRSPRPTRVGRHLRVDNQGRLIPRTEAEKIEDHQALLQAFAEMDAIPDDPPGSDEELFRAIDAGRPERPLFREYYES